MEIDKDDIVVFKLAIDDLLGTIIKRNPSTSVRNLGVIWFYFNGKDYIYKTFKTLLYNIRHLKQIRQDVLFYNNNHD